MWNVSFADLALWLFVNGRPVGDEPSDAHEHGLQRKRRIEGKAMGPRMHTLFSQSCVFPGVFELPAFLYPRAACPAYTGSVVA